MLNQLVWINLIWGFTNLLPIFPLDGGQVVREIVLAKAPRRGDAFVLTISFYAALFLAFVSLGWFIYQHMRGLGEDLFPAIFFGILAIESRRYRRYIIEYGSLGGSEERREAWEQDPDWWKRR
jgi:Zn-dependent protease